MSDTQAKTKQILKSWELFKKTDNSTMVNQRALEQAINQIESLTAQLEEVKENQRIAIEALAVLLAECKEEIKQNIVSKKIFAITKAEQALSIIRGK